MWSGPLAEDREPTQRQGPERRRAAPAAGGRAGLVSAAFAVEACERGRASEGGYRERRAKPDLLEYYYERQI